MTDVESPKTRRSAAEERPFVLVTIGTNDHPFTRLIDWIDAYAAEHPEVRFLVQHGYSRAPSAVRGEDFIEQNRLRSLMRQAAAVVTHGGPATIAETRQTGHLPIAVARDAELGEHTENHQPRFVARLDSSGMVYSCASFQQLTATLDKALAQPGDFRLAGDPDETTAAVARHAGDLIDLLAPTASEERPLPGPVRLPADDDWPEVTVIVATRDRPGLLRRTLRSIVDQDYPGRIITLLVYDNDDPDHTLADDSEERPVRILGNTLTPGLAGARNTGVLASWTELVAFCDDDDSWLPHKLRSQVDVMRAEPDTEVVCCGVRVIYDRSEAERVLYRTSVTFADLLSSRVADLHPSTFLIRRDAMVHGCGPVSEDIPGSYGENYELLLRLARRAPIRNIPEAGVRVLWHHRSHSGGRWQTISTALRWLLSQYPEFRLVPRGLARISGKIAFAEAASGRRGAALEWALAALRARPTEARAYLALAVVCGLSADRIVRALHKRGRGI
ncbi:glycosyltransferase [Allosalinactinospora lopnorensis]|uniref:glycosyltransferase n=1 Tax=Allosalinactinospora lopnorensis TaxID=1352348 RepID=UPI000623BC9C|nr:glycosyltransferase [Allosalinactinospora lopnorensis]